MIQNVNNNLYKSTKNHVATVRAYADKDHMEKNEALFVSDVCIDIIKVSSEEDEAQLISCFQKSMETEFSDMYKGKGYSNVFIDINMNSVQKTA